MRFFISRTLPKTPLHFHKSVSFHFSAYSRGLEEFFDSPEGWKWTESDLPVGTEWTSEILRRKSFQDLHNLWWVCLKEKNKLESQREEANLHCFEFPFKDRLRMLNKSMKAIKFVVTERKMAYERAQDILNLQNAKLQMKDEILKSKTNTQSDENQEIELSKEEERQIVLKVLQTVPAPSLGPILSSVGMGLNPHQEGMVTKVPSLWRNIRLAKKKRASEKQETQYSLV